MSTVFYIIAIVIIVASAAVSFMKSQDHRNLIKDTYNLRVENDQLELDINARDGSDVKIDDIKDDGDKATNVEAATNLVYQRAITGFDNGLEYAQETSDDAVPYEKTINGEKIVFVPLNEALENVAAGDDTGQVAFLQQPATDVETAKGKLAAVTAVANSLTDYADLTLEKDIKALDSTVEEKKSERESLNEETSTYIQAEERIQVMFSSEGITTLEEGKTKLDDLQVQQDDLITQKDALFSELSTLNEIRDKNVIKLTEQKGYFSERKAQITANQKTFKLDAVNFEWGFGVIKLSPSTKFFVNQKLMVFRGNRYIGNLIVSSIEPGRALVNIDYDSVSKGYTFRAGDKVFLADSADL